MQGQEKTVAAHYTRGNLGETILAALRAAGKDLDALTREDLAPVDAFHIRGPEATRELAVLGELTSEMKVLDLGCGLGGSARHLAGEWGCRVTGVDLTAEYCEVAAMLSERLGLGHLVEFHNHSALDLPFPEASFDRVWTEHAQMNIQDKQGFYAQVLRMLKPGGRFLFHDVLAGAGDPPHYPAPWADDPALSFLISPEALREMLGSLGLRELHWEDCTTRGTEWFQQPMARSAKKGPPPLGSHILHGEQAKVRLGNQVRNLAENRVTTVQAVWAKPGE